MRGRLNMSDQVAVESPPKPAKIMFTSTEKAFLAKMDFESLPVRQLGKSLCEMRATGWYFLFLSK